MTRKVIVALIVLFGILWFGMIVLCVHSIFYSFTLFGLEEVQYKALVSIVITVLTFVIALLPIFQKPQKILRLDKEQYKALVSDVVLLVFNFALALLSQASQNTRKLRPNGAHILITGNRCRCGYEWRPKNMDLGCKVCPKCKSPYWDRPRMKRQDRVMG